MNMKYLDIDYLRSFKNATIHHFGLGFVQLKLDKSRRLHFWNNDLETLPENEFHDHRYDFTSYVLHGTLNHETWNYILDDTGGYELVEVSCDVNENPTNRSYICKPYNSGSYSITKGSAYYFNHNEFHRSYSNECITYLERGPVVKDFARVIRPSNNPTVCPFETSMNEQECWDFVEHMCNKALPGYHLREIEKGEVGQSSKILEEVQELIDAEEQENRIMSMVELSDIVGSIQSYLEHNYNEITFDDLFKMSEATRRAFRNGHR